MKQIMEALPESHLGRPQHAALVDMFNVMSSHRLGTVSHQFCRMMVKSHRPAMPEIHHKGF